MMNTYAAIYKNNEIREKSSSGGVFSLLAQQFDVVYGVAMTEDCYGAEMIRVEGDIEPLRGSKYLQAKVGDSFKRVKEDLLAGKKVLFSGTGCQINGIHMFLGKDYEGLYCLDVICHGVPSPKLWREYAQYQEKNYGRLKHVDFRCKEGSWIDFGMKENQVYISKDRDSYMRMFLRDYSLRPSCYECHAKYDKTSDITIADFWGIGKVAPEMNDRKGTSLVITRTKKGQQLFDGVKDELQWKKVSYEDGVKNNPSELRSVPRPPQRDTFYEDFNQLSFEEMEKKYAADIQIPLYRRVIRKVQSIVKKIIGKGYAKVRSDADYGVLLSFKK